MPMFQVKLEITREIEAGCETDAVMELVDEFPMDLSPHIKVNEMNDSKCPECGADLTQEGAVNVTETENYRLKYSPGAGGVEHVMHGRRGSPDQTSTEIRCNNCRVELGLDLL